VRIARTPDGRLEIGPGPGRGVWLCAGSLDCFEQAVQRKALGRALRKEVSAAEVDALRAKLFE
jgi:predicted RNA-binding protein YlxR (DUF448 family)